MAINDFSAFLQLMATFSIAFVAVEYVKSFTESLCKKFFKFNEYINTQFNYCRTSLADEVTIASLEVIEVKDGKTTFTKNEGAKRKRETLIKEICEQEKTIKDKVTDVCQAKSMSSMCLFISISCIVLLFTGSIEARYCDFSRFLCTTLCFFSMLYLFVGWVFGEVEKPIRYCNFASFRNATIGFVCLFVVSFVFSLVAIIFFEAQSKLIVDKVWWWMLMLYVLFTCANYIIFFFKINNSANNFKKRIHELADALRQKCEMSKKEVDDLVTAQSVIMDVIADQP